MASLSHGNPRCNVFSKSEAMFSVGGVTAFPFFQPMACAVESCFKGQGRYPFQSLHVKEASAFPRNKSHCMISKKLNRTITGSSNSPDSSSSKDDSSDKAKVPFGYSRKDVIFIGLGVTVLGVGLKSGLEYVGVDPLQAGNVVQLVLVLGLTIGWISTYIFRVSNKEMTYAQQLRDYESQVMQKRLEGLTEAELEALLEQVEEDKRRLVSDEKVK